MDPQELLVPQQKDPRGQLSQESETSLKGIIIFSHITSNLESILVDSEAEPTCVNGRYKFRFHVMFPISHSKD